MFFNDTATTEIYTLSLHDALPICVALGPSVRPDRALQITLRFAPQRLQRPRQARRRGRMFIGSARILRVKRSEEHTSELQSRQYLVCRLLLEKKNTSVVPISASGS